MDGTNNSIRHYHIIILKLSVFGRTRRRLALNQEIDIDDCLSWRISNGQEWRLICPIFSEECPIKT